MLARACAVLAAGCLLVGARSLAGGIEVGDDLFLGTWSPFGSRWEAVAPVCVWSDEQERGPFRITATGLASASAFTMRDGAGYPLPYDVSWQRTGGGGRVQTLTPGVPLRFAVPGEKSVGCTAGPTGNVRVRVSRGDIERAPPGIYRDTLLLTISPL